MTCLFRVIDSAFWFWVVLSSGATIGIGALMLVQAAKRADREIDPYEEEFKL
jgi:hypothetical protein